ncbi:MAG: protein kinase [Planctomycetota bacterium]
MSSSEASSPALDFLAPPKNPETEMGSLGHYRVIRELGRGGMGFVFLAEDTKLKREVALKVMNQKIAATPGSRTRFISEARAMAAVHHDNVATIFEVGEQNGTPFMAMELLEGSTLEDYRERHGEPDFKTVIAMAKDIARGLGAAHAKGIVHRDIKPANIWQDTKTNRIKVLDFGLALAQTPVDQLSGRGAVVGTPGYLSPEQARSEPLDDRSDLYSVGVVLYELACGSLPLKTKSVADQLIAILAHPAKPLRERNDQIPQPLADLIHRLMAKEPRDRFQSAKDLEAALEQTEKDCESKTEVAQAINQLQRGLQQAVAKKTPAGSFASETEAMPNPFDSLPGVGIPAAAKSNPSASPGGTGSASTSGLHRVAPGVAASDSNPYAKANPANRKGNTKTASSGSRSTWIVLGIAAAVVVLMIPAVVYFSTTNAIARQQADGMSVVIDHSATNNASGSSTTNRTAADSVKSSQSNETQASPASQSSLPPLQDRPRISASPIKPLVIKNAGARGAKWILGTEKGNGSFEQGVEQASQAKIPGWRMQAFGRAAGWRFNPSERRKEFQTFGFAGPESELFLTSEPSWYRVNQGDVICVTARLGGNGSQRTRYELVLGFQPETGSPVRYQLASLDDSSKWGSGKVKQVAFGYRIDSSLQGMRPFVEVLVSNAGKNRRTGMIDQVIMTAFSEAIADSALGLNTSSTAGMKSEFDNTGKPGQGNESTNASGMSPSGLSSSGNTTAGLDAGMRETNRSGTATDNGQRSGNVPVAVPTKEVVISTGDEEGADATVKRGSSATNPFGSKPSLVVQTRNNRQIQHAYLRFIVESIRGSRGGRGGGFGNRGNTNPIERVQLKLSVLEISSPATIRVFGFDDRVSDVWPEDRLVWSNSLSSEGIGTLPMLADVTVEPDEKEVSIESVELTRFIAESKNRSVTLILTGSSGTELVSFAAKESVQRPPTLVISVRDR